MSIIGPASDYASTLRHILWRAGLAMVLLCGVAPAAQAQTFSILHTFMGAEGCNPIGGPTIDRTGNLYGTTSGCGGGAGTVFKLTHAGSGWVVDTLYTFTGDDGSDPRAGVVFGPDGALYGTTSGRTEGGLLGTVFKLRPPNNPCHSISCRWNLTALYDFTDVGAGSQPGYGNVAFDAASNVYGTTVVGGTNGAGTVYKLTHSNGGRTQSVLYSFGTSDDGGYFPYGGVVLDGAGNVYGTTDAGGAYGGGVLFQLTQVGSSWTETVLHNFGNGDGLHPVGAPIMDQQGNLYGTTSSGPGDQTGGTVYELQRTGDSWTYSVLAILPALPGTEGPVGALTMDGAGNLYGTSSKGGSNGYGSVFKLTRSGGTWIYTDLHDFNNQDGAYPYGSVARDAQGNIYGTTYSGGGAGHGEAWMITP